MISDKRRGRVFAGMLTAGAGAAILRLLATGLPLFAQDDRSNGGKKDGNKKKKGGGEEGEGGKKAKKGK